MRLRMDGCRSLKDKRQILRSLFTRARNRYNISVAEVDSHDLWNAADIAVVCVARDYAVAGHTVEAFRDLVLDTLGIEVLDEAIEQLEPGGDYAEPF